MPTFATHSKPVGDAIQAGAYDYLGSYASGRSTRSEAIATIMRVFGRIPGLTSRAAGAIIDRYDSSIASAKTLLRRRSDRPLTDAEFTGLPGQQSSYRYQFKVTFKDWSTDRQWSELVNVDSDESLSKQAAIGKAEDAAYAIIMARQDRSIRGSDWRSAYIGEAQLTMATMPSRER